METEMMIFLMSNNIRDISEIGYELSIDGY